MGAYICKMGSTFCSTSLEYLLLLMFMYNAVLIWCVYNTITKVLYSGIVINTFSTFHYCKYIIVSIFSKGSFNLIVYLTHARLPPPFFTTTCKTLIIILVIVVIIM